MDIAWGWIRDKMDQIGPEVTSFQEMLTIVGFKEDSPIHQFIDESDEHLTIVNWIFKFIGETAHLKPTEDPG